MFDPATDQFTHFSDPGTAGIEGIVLDISQDRKGMLWIASYHGLYRLDPATLQNSRILQHEPDDRPPVPHPEIETAFVPESGRIFRQLFTRAAAVNFSNDSSAPLLLVACGKDGRIPPKTVYLNFGKYRAAGTRRVECIEFGNLSHFSIAEPGHEMLAEYCLDWARCHAFRRRNNLVTA